MQSVAQCVSYWPASQLCARCSHAYLALVRSYIYTGSMLERSLALARALTSHPRDISRDIAYARTTLLRVPWPGSYINVQELGVSLYKAWAFAKLGNNAMNAATFPRPVMKLSSWLGPASSVSTLRLTRTKPCITMLCLLCFQGPCR